MGTDKNQNQQPKTRPSGRAVYPPPGSRPRGQEDPHRLQRYLNEDDN